SFCADVNDWVADTFGFGEEDVFFAGYAQSECIDERVLRVARFEGDFAADRWHAEAVAVVAYAADDAIEDATILGSLFFRSALARGDFAEAEGIKDRDRPCAHCKNVAEDAAYSRGRALERLDVARVIVRFDLEGGD